MFIFSFPNSQGKHFLIFQSENLWGLQRTPWILASLCPSSVNLSTKFEKKSPTSEVSISSSELLSTTSDLSWMTRPHPLTPRTDQTLALMPKVELLLPPAKSPKQVKSKASLGGRIKGGRELDKLLPWIQLGPRGVGEKGDRGVRGVRRMRLIRHRASTDVSRALPRSSGGDWKSTLTFACKSKSLSLRQTH